jgi:hypothetical protein
MSRIAFPISADGPSRDDHGRRQECRLTRHLSHLRDGVTPLPARSASNINTPVDPHWIVPHHRLIRGCSIRSGPNGALEP